MRVTYDSCSIRESSCSSWMCILFRPSDRLRSQCSGTSSFGSCCRSLRRQQLSRSWRQNSNPNSIGTNRADLVHTATRVPLLSCASEWRAYHRKEERCENAKRNDLHLSRSHVSILQKRKRIWSFKNGDWQNKSKLESRTQKRKNKYANDLVSSCFIFTWTA